MAMLAEPKRRVKYSTDPRGLEWSSDADKFGQKMLEKMGWEKGKGLGANEDGRVEHVKVDVKQNTRGVGCSKSYADNWIANQDDFNSLLSQLNSNHGDKGDNNEEEGESEHKVMSLEAKSKTSKSRVHYQKFTKGKDLSMKKKDDLACIFGKRKSKSEGNTPVQSEVNSDAEDAKPQTEKDSKMDTSHGVTTVTSSTSVADYFAEKMAKLQKTRTCTGQSDRGTAPAAAQLTEDTDHSDEGISFTAKTGAVEGIENSCAEEEGEEETAPKSSKKKKKKKSKRKCEEDVCESENASSKKKRKRKGEEVNEEDVLECNTSDGDSEDRSIKKKKKKKKSKTSKAEATSPEEPTSVEPDSEIPEDSVEVCKKSRKRKSKDKINETVDTKDANENVSAVSPEEGQNSKDLTKKKKKKRKQREAQATIDTECDSAVENDANQTSSGGKKRPSEVTQEIWSVTDKETSPGKGKKKSKLDKDKIKLSKGQGFEGSNLKEIRGYAAQKAAEVIDSSDSKSQ